MTTETPTSTYDWLLGRFLNRLAGPRVTGVNHDYAALRQRFSRHVGAYGWAEKFCLFGLVLVVEVNRDLHRGVRVRLRKLNAHDMGWYRG